MIKENIRKLQCRKEIPKYIKEIREDTNSNLVKGKIIKKYEYWKCDYCNDEIRLDKKQAERSGGIVNFPHTLTKCGRLQLVLCNKCLNSVIREFLNKNERN